MTGGLWIALVLLAAVLLGAALWLLRSGRAGRAEAHRQEREGAALAALMGEGPAAILWWPKGESEPRATPGLAAVLKSEIPVTGLAQILPLLAPGDGARLSGSIERLRQEGTGFELLVRLAASEDVLQATGLSREGTAAIWLRDVTDWVSDAARLRQERAALAAALDALPLPVWRRTADGRLL